MYLAGHSHVLLTLAIAGNGGWQARPAPGRRQAENSMLGG